MKVSHEAAVLAQLEAAVGDVAGAAVHRGMGAANRFGVPGWDLVAGQQLQFGDLRIETDRATVIVEAESAGGVTNLAKYWPLLAVGTYPKRLVLAHLFLMGSKGDYISHRLLWAFLRNRMVEGLERHGVMWRRDWEAALFTYVRGEAPEEAARFIRDALAVGDVDPPSEP